MRGSRDVRLLSEGLMGAVCLPRSTEKDNKTCGYNLTRVAVQSDIEAKVKLRCNVPRLKESSSLCLAAIESEGLRALILDAGI